MDNLDNIEIASPNIVVKYKGGITTEVVDSLLSLVLHRLENIEQNINVRKKVYSILMECSQNIQLHHDNISYKTGSQEVEVSNAYLSIEGNDSGYHITSANFIENLKLKALVSALESINHQNTPDDLKKLYNQAIRNTKYSTKGGGGLGLIDVARKSSGKLNYTFNKVNEVYSFFILNVIIKKY